MEQAAINMKLPWMRAQLVDFLRGLSDHEYQKKNWQVFRGEHEDYDEMDYTIHFLYDDTDLSRDSTSLIGELLSDEEEARLIRDIVAAIDHVFDLYGLNLKDSDYISKPEWGKVIQAASEALPKFVANGVGSFDRGGAETSR